MNAGISQNGHTFSQLLKRAIYVPALLLISMAALLLWHLSHFNRTIVSFQRAEENIFHLGEIRAQAIHLMSDLRGYLIFRERNMVSGFPSRIESLLETIKQMEAGLSDSPQKGEYLQAMSQSLQAWSQLAEETIQFSQTHRGQFAPSFLQRTGIKLMAEFLDHLNFLLKNESVLMDQRAGKYHAYRNTFAALILLGAIAIALILIFFSRSQLKRLSASFDTSQSNLRLALEERRNRQANSDFLSEATKRLSTSLDFHRNLSEIAQFSLPQLADWIAVDLVNPSDPKTTLRLFVYHRNPDKKHLAEELLKLGPSHRKSPSREAIGTGEPQILLYISNQQLATLGGKPEVSALLNELGTYNMAVFPMIARGKTLGSLTFVLGDSGRDFSKAQLDLCAELTRRTSASVDNGLLYQEAQEAAQARDEFLSIASHELKTPMTALSLQLQLLVRELKSRAELSSSYQGIQLCLNQVRRLTELLDDLLDMTRIRAGQVVLHKTLIDLPELLCNIVKRFQPEAQALGTSLTITAENPLSGIWDPLRLEQIFTNLISNAIKYGNRQPVEISVSRRGSQGVVTVQDHGPGIEPEFQKKIFRRFERAPSCGHLGGLGLGLYITHQLVQAHQGTIRLRSEIGRGSQFIVTLPIADLSEGSLPVQKQAS